MWRSLKKTKPHPGIRVKIKHQISGFGAPEREGWETTGIYTSNSNWIIRQNGNVNLELKPTHWDWVKD